MTPYFILLIAGLAGGFLSGLIGIGGGIVYVISLELFLKEAGIAGTSLPQVIIANSVLAIFFATSSGTITLIRKKVFYYKQVLIISISSIAASLIVLSQIVHSPYFDEFIFSVIISFILLFILLKLWFYKSYHNNERATAITWKAGTLTGIFGGALSALSGLGGGVIMVPLLNQLGKVHLRDARSVSIGVICTAAAVMTAYHLIQPITLEKDVLHTGYIVWPAVTVLSMGVMVTAPLGVRVSEKLSGQKIAIIYSIFLVTLLVYKATILYGRYAAS